MPDTTSHPSGQPDPRRVRGPADPEALVRRGQIRRPAPFLAIALVVVIGIGGFLTLGHRRDQRPVVLSSQMIATGVGAIDSLRLPDGTRVVLRPLSSVTIVKGYGRRTEDS